MDVSGDRGQAMQVGAILLFGILIVGLSLYQATIVPNQNEQVEFDSYLEASGDMEELQNQIGTAAARDYSTRTAVKTGAAYPSRTIFINPGPPGNRLRTSQIGDGNVTIANATAVNGEEDNTIEYWNETRPYTTTSLRFDPNYNRLQAPSIVYENGILYRPANDSVEPPYGPNETIVVSQGSFVDGNRITLVTLDGDLDTGGMSPTVVANPVSAHTRTVVVENQSATENVTITVSSRLDATTWENRILDGETAFVGATQVDDTTVALEFANTEPLELRLAKVELKRPTDSSTVNSPEPEYIISAAGDGESISQNQSAKLTAEVRDTYNNPKQGVSVEFSTTDGAFSQGGSTRTVTTNGEGQASVQFEPDSTGELEVEASINGGEVNTTTFTVNVDEGGAGTGGGGGDTTNPSSDLASLVWQSATVPEKGEDVSVTFENTANDSISISEVRYQFYSIDSQGGGGVGDAPKSLTITDFDDNDTTSTINYVGPYTDVDAELDHIPAGNTPTYTFKFYVDENQGGGRFDADSGDFFVISVKYELSGSTNTATYFIGIATP